MQATFDSLVPIFLLILCGNVLRWLGATDDAGWDSVNKLCYWFFYPALIFVTILDADFGSIELGPLMVALALALPLMFVLVLALWPPLRNARLVRHSEFSSVFQTSIRWNGFMALAIAQKLFAPAGMAVVALVMAVIILPINLMTVYVVTRFADRGADWSASARGCDWPISYACASPSSFR
ncbi:hypothetical protein ABMA46_13615 [Mesorhizobium sp. CN5-321]|jgi:predicted permease|uniref:AEC family transporter n=1 Tax=Mesorhizobium hunchu TaxID=3157708 RepID=UPI0032B77AC3